MLNQDFAGIASSMGKLAAATANSSPSPAIGARPAATLWPAFPVRLQGWNWERAGWCLLLVALVAAAPISLNRSIRNLGGTDFPEFYAAGQHVLEQGTIKPRAMTAYYLPSLNIAWAGLAVLPLPVAAVVWYAIGCGAWFALLASIRRYVVPDLDASIARQATLVAGLLITPLVADQLCIGAFHGLMLWLMVAGLGRACRGQAWSGGALLGLAVWLKLLPALGIAYLLLKRRWQAAFVAAAVAFLVNGALCLAVFGPTQTCEVHRQWLVRDAAGTADALLTSPKKLNEQRVTNQSLPAVLRRVLTQLGTPSGSSRDLAAIGHLSGPQVKVVYGTIIGALLLGGAWFCRRSWRTTSLAQGSAELALLTLSLLWFSPIAPSYHPIAAAPALALLTGRNMFRPLGWSVVLLWIAAMVLHAFPTARAFGHVLWITMTLGLLIVWISRPRLAQSPNASLAN